MEKQKKNKSKKTNDAPVAQEDVSNKLQMQDDNKDLERVWQDNEDDVNAVCE